MNWCRACRDFGMAEMLDYIEDLRGAVLHWKAWVTPEKGKRLA